MEKPTEEQKLAKALRCYERLSKAGRKGGKSKSPAKMAHLQRLAESRRKPATAK